MYYDLTQQLLIWNIFSEGYKKPGYSKDGKFKEDQIVIGGNWENGIPLHYKIFPEMLLIQILSYHLCWNADIYEVNSVTIILTKEWVLIEILDFRI